MKRNTLSLSLLLSTALVVPTIAMADLTGYNETADTSASVMPVDGSLQEGEEELLTTPDQPNLDSDSDNEYGDTEYGDDEYETETITEDDGIDTDTDTDTDLDTDTDTDTDTDNDLDTDTDDIFQ